MSEKKKIVVGITGASGAPYAKLLVTYLNARAKNEGDVEVGVCISSTAPEVWQLECGGDLREQIAALGIPVWGLRDFKAPFASGSAGWHSMVIVPCSMGTCGRIAHGISDTLLTRAADVMIKERRGLVIVPRETPLSTIHLENLLTLSKAGAVVMPAMPSFYGKPSSIDDLVKSVCARVLDHLGVPQSISHKWGSAHAEQAKQAENKS